MDDIEIPKFFVCPISLQIMKDPVTTATGITYDRDSIERWQFGGRNHMSTCPVTNQQLPPDSSLTPNHTLRRLIQSWCASKGIDQIPTLNTPVRKSHVINLLKNLRVVKKSQPLETLKELEVLATTSKESDRICMKDAGVAEAMANFIQICHVKREIVGLKEALNLLYLIGTTTPDQTRLFLNENEQMIDSLTWVLGLEDVAIHASFKSHAVLLLKTFIDKAHPSVLERLKRDFFEKVVLVVKERGMSQSGTRAALNIMLSACAWGRNRILMVEAKAVFELIELGLTFPEKATTELIFGVLFHLCSSADGREQLLNHAAGLAFLSKKLLRVSPKADDRIVLILSLILKFSGTNGVLQEMLRLGTVSKLCMLLQHDRASYLKEKARELLRSHSDVWNNSDCVKISVVTRYSR